MKRIIFLIAGLCLVSSSGFAASVTPKDSVSLVTESIMTSNLGRSSDDGIPIGLITAWATDQEIPDGWLECNGQVVNSTKYPEYVETFGHTVPDYRGMFLCGYGGNSGALGEVQDYSVQTNSSSKIVLQNFGLNELNLVEDVTLINPSIPSNPAITLKPGSLNTTMTITQVFVAGEGNQADGLDISIDSVDGETRPINKAVRYIVKVGD